MKQTITTTDLKKAVGEIVSSVRLRGDCYVIEQRGKEGAALVPMSVLRSYERSRKRMTDLMGAVAEASGLSDEEAMQLALEEVAASRAERRSGKGKTHRSR